MSKIGKSTLVEWIGVLLSAAAQQFSNRTVVYFKLWKCQSVRPGQFCTPVILSPLLFFLIFTSIIANFIPCSSLLTCS